MASMQRTFIYQKMVHENMGLLREHATFQVYYTTRPLSDEV